MPAHIPLVAILSPTTPGEGKTRPENLDLKTDGGSQGVDDSCPLSCWKCDTGATLSCPLLPCAMRCMGLGRLKAVTRVPLPAPEKKRMHSMVDKAARQHSQALRISKIEAKLTCEAGLGRGQAGRFCQRATAHCCELGHGLVGAWLLSPVLRGIACGRVMLADILRTAGSWVATFLYYTPGLT